MKLSILLLLLTMIAGCQKDSDLLSVDSIGQDHDVAALQALTRLVVFNLSKVKDLHELTDGIITEEEAKSLVGKTGLWSANEVRLWFVAVNNVAYKIHQKGMITDFSFGDASLASCQAAAEGAFVAKVGGVAGITALASASITGVGAFFAGLVLTGALIQYAAAMQDCSEEYPDGIWDIHHDPDTSQIVIPEDFHLVLIKLATTYAGG